MIFRFLVWFGPKFDVLLKPLGLWMMLLIDVAADGKPRVTGLRIERRPATIPRPFE